jgi:hypothetical protein
MVLQLREISGQLLPRIAKLKVEQLFNKVLPNATEFDSSLG